MQDFFLIGGGDPSFRNSAHLVSMPQFQGVINTEATPIVNRFTGGDYQYTIPKLKTVSFGDFLNHARKNPGVKLISFYDFIGGHLFLKKLKEVDRFNIDIQDYYNFHIDHNIPLIFVPARDEREQILAGAAEWAEFRKQLTDDFSKLSLDCYLSAIEAKDLSKMRPAYIDPTFLFYNRYSRKLGLVPRADEIAVDVGAWDGDTLVKYVDCADGYREMHVFEPQKDAAAKLKKREFYLNNYYVHAVAASNYTGEMEFCVGGVGTRASALAPEDAPVERLPCVKLDDVLKEVTLLKIEAEGHEAKIIEGAAGLIAKCRPEICAQAYHFPLDPIRILEQVNKIHKYKHISLRFYTIDPHLFSLLFSDRAPFT